jgi:isocitrate dehydrogenase kinase/phosphatase
MKPLNVYLRTADVAAARRAIRDYGQAIRDLALSNVFPGDLLLKNFGISRHGRVIFYDYDELCLVTECSFRDMPAARDDEDEMRRSRGLRRPERVPEQWLNFSGSRVRCARSSSTTAMLSADYWRS